VEQGLVGGTNWYRVRVGRYATEREAKETIAKMQPAMETDLWVTRVGK
jgi:cell division protein FtsN